MTILAIDYGEKRIGLAVSDPAGMIAHGLPTLAGDDAGAAFEEVARIVADRAVELIVVGLPLNMDGSEGSQARKVRGFVKTLSRYVPGTPIELMDERLTSQQAHRSLSQAGVTYEKRMENVDRMAAQIILQKYLGKRRTMEEGGDQARSRGAGGSGRTEKNQ